MRIWHDNSGAGQYASWYLRHIVVQDLQTKEKFVFIATRWFAVEERDGQVRLSVESVFEIRPLVLQIRYFRKGDCSYHTWSSKHCHCVKTLTFWRSSTVATITLPTI